MQLLVGLPHLVVFGIMTVGRRHSCNIFVVCKQRKESIPCDHLSMVDNVIFEENLIASGALFYLTQSRKQNSELPCCTEGVGISFCQEWFGQ